MYGLTKAFKILHVMVLSYPGDGRQIFQLTDSWVLKLYAEN